MFRVAAVLTLAIFLSHISRVDAGPQLTQSEAADVQPLKLHSQRIKDALEFLGSPLDQNSLDSLQAAEDAKSDADTLRSIQSALDPRCLAEVVINPESRVKVNAGPANAILDQNGWQVFLVKVHNLAGVTAPLKVQSAQAEPIAGSPAADVADRWLQAVLYQQRPLAERLSGIALEYVPIVLYSRDAGKRSAVFSFDVGQGTQDLGFRSDIQITFECRPAIPVSLSIKDETGQPTTAALEIRDRLGRVYPSMAKRLAPDFHFHPQIYRGDGEQIELPAGDYQIQVTRGPEFLPISKSLHVDSSGTRFSAELQRWIDPSLSGWWSGDHHIHAAGCAHYTDPTQGVHAADMIRHCLGEDLKIGANLTWGPCFDYQKQFFTGSIDPVSKYPYLLRYDVEVSGFGSHQSGHLCLLRLHEQMYPGGESTQHWPTLGLNTLRWAQAQGAVCGPAHSGWGLEVDSQELPNTIIPPFNGIGANEYIVDVTHRVPGPGNTEVPAVDFISLCDTPMIWELNIWYHTLNCGYRTRGSGETDFPCIYGQRVGIGRSYVHLDGQLDYDRWCEGISRGANYISDGRSHLIDFRANAGQSLSERTVRMGDGESELQLDGPGPITATATVAAMLDPQANEIGRLPYTQQPYWHLERARIGNTREVLVELIVNGYPVASQRLTADGKPRELSFNADIRQSSWIALRILGSSHTNPIFVMVDGQPIRASRKSAQWCLDGVQQCWSQKQRFIKPEELADAESAYEHARAAYQRILSECTTD